MDFNASKPVIFTLLLILLATGCGRPSLTTIHGSTMGTTYSIKIVDAVDETKLRAAVELRLEDINQLMSTYIPHSEISQINDLAVGEQMAVSHENLAMLSLSRRLYEESNGKFDVTIGPLVDLWGFGPDPSQTQVPDASELEASRLLLGLGNLRVTNNTLLKLAPVSIDFSAIAKGYGVDELARLVEAEGATNYLVEIGGELRARGHNAAGEVWRIGIETPDSVRREVFSAIPLRDRAMATSGDYRNYFEVDGVRYSHTIDPTTGFPITHNVASVTVLAESAAEADGYATAINVMGVDAGMKLANTKGLAIFVILKADSGFDTQSSRAFAEYINETRNSK